MKNRYLVYLSIVILLVSSCGTTKKPVTLVVQAKPEVEESSISDIDKNACIAKINESLVKASKQLIEAEFLLINNTLVIRNVGNVPYDKLVQIKGLLSIKNSVEYEEKLVNENTALTASKNAERLLKWAREKLSKN